MTMEAGKDLRAEPWEGLSGLLASEPFWQELRPRIQGETLCNTPEWVLAYARSYPPEQDLFGWRVSTKEGLGVGLFAFRKEPSRGKLSLSRALFAQDGSFDSDYLEPAVAQGFERAAWETVLGELARKKGIEAVVLSCIDPNSAFLAHTRELLRAQGTEPRELEVGCTLGELPEDWDTFLKGLKSRMRSKVRSSLRTAESRGADYRWCDDPEKLEGHLEGLFELHAMRWREQGEEGSFADPARRCFYRNLMPVLLEKGSLRFARVEIDGRPVAYQIGAVHDGRYSQIQEGFDTAFTKDRVGIALRAWFIQRLIEEGVSTYDFMAGVARHKSDWGGSVTNCVTLAFPLPKLRAKMAYGARALLDRWRS